tara:strand:- start:79 stop:2004 length:1926 start_codon:yes stop_codon:yes gene_type:complete
MCGITGFNFNDKGLVKRMLKTISHRGPDQDGIYEDKGITLGHKRLSIIDLSSKGKQPMSNEDGDIWITFNGEIYNYKELKSELKNHKFSSNTDTEVILHAYEEFGYDCLEKLNGMFAFGIWDSKKKVLFLARDRAGIKPLYYYLKDDEFIFCSELKGILEHENVMREIDVNVLNKMSSLKYNIDEKTILKDIWRVLPSQYLIYDTKSRKIEKKDYWSPFNEISNKSEGFFTEKLSELLEDSVEKRLMSDVPLGVYLSGGIDSSTMVALMTKINKRNEVNEEIKTFSVGFGYGEETDELEYAKITSDYFNTDHKEYMVKSDLVNLLPKIVWHMDEPISELALIPLYLLSQNAKKDVTVVLTGDGADEIFAGYEQYKYLTLAWKTRFLPKLLKNKMAPFLLENSPLSIRNKFFKYSAALGKEGLKRSINVLKSVPDKGVSYVEFVSFFNDEERSKLFNEEIKKQISEFSFSNDLNKKYFMNSYDYLNQLLYLELKTLLPENYLMKTDKMTMAHGVEARVPFLDHRLIEFSYQVPPKLKLNNFTEKYVLKKAVRDIVPPKIATRKKQRFYVPVDIWIKKDLKYLVDSLLSKKNITKQNYFNYSHIKKIIDNYDSSRLVYGRQLWTLINFQIWHKIYIDKENPKI